MPLTADRPPSSFGPDTDASDPQRLPDEQGDGDEVHGDPPMAGRQDRWLSLLGIGLISIGTMLFWRGFQIEGHNGGDDFALYIDQARSLLQGNVGETLGNTRYAVDNSAWHTFSPYGYPWGLPLLLVPVMAISGAVDPRTGIDYAPLKSLIALCFLIGLFGYHALLRRRIGWLGAVLLPLFFALNFTYVIHLDNVLSEIPFLMSLMLFMVAFDRLREKDLLLGRRLLPLVGLGLLACFAFNIRREGLGALAGLALGQAALIWQRSTAPGLRARVKRIQSLDWQAIVTPWAAFAGGSILLQMVLPSEIFPKYVERDPAATAGLHRIVENLRIYKPLLAEHLGLKDLGPYDIVALHSRTGGAVVFWAVIAFACLGIVLTVLRHPARDLSVVGVFLGVGLVVMSAPFQAYRYIMALVPFLVYFSYQGIALTVQMIPSRAAPFRHVAKLVVIADLAVIGFIAGGWQDTAHAREFRSDFIGPQAGPQQPAALEMYQAVRTLTRGDSIIVISRARMATLYTGRRSVQGGTIDFVERAGDYYVMYLEPDGTPGTYSQYPLDAAEARERGFTEIWRNESWVIYETPFWRASR